MKEGRKALGRRFVAMLQHHPELDPLPATDVDHLLGARSGDLERLLEQHVFAGFGASAREIEVRGGRGQHGDRIDRPVLENRLQALALREWELLGELRAACRTRTERVGDLDPVSEIQCAVGVRHHCHAEAYYCNA
jgi:hypothetical protein